MGLYVAAVWAFPAHIYERLAGLLLGAVVFILVNFLCVPSLFYLGLYLPGFLPGWMPEAHVYVWQALVLALSAIAWFGWANWVRLSRRSLWRALLLRSAMAFVLLVPLWGVVAPSYAYLLTAAGRPFGLLLETHPGTRYLAESRTIVAAREVPRVKQAGVVTVQKRLWTSQYHIPLLIALVLATPGWSLRQRGHALGLSLVLLFLLDLALFLINVEQLRPIAIQSAGTLSASPSQAVPSFSQGVYPVAEFMGREFLVLLIYTGLVTFLWQPTGERALERIASTYAETHSVRSSPSQPPSSHATAAATAANRRLVTVMFTDIVGSTERAVELGDRRWCDLLEHHHVLVRRELARSQGQEIDTAGDGFFSIFDAPARAVQCASAITQVVKQLGIEIRAGIHAGEVEALGAKVSGIAVHTGARVAGQAGASEVLVTSTVKDLVAGSAIRFEDRGVHVLKGVPGEWHLFAVQRIDNPPPTESLASPTSPA
jgi:class 3 adenylate cyclase